MPWHVLRFFRIRKYYNAGKMHVSRAHNKDTGKKQMNGLCLIFATICIIFYIENN